MTRAISNVYARLSKGGTFAEALEDLHLRRYRHTCREYELSQDKLEQVPCSEIDDPDRNDEGGSPRALLPVFLDDPERRAGSAVDRRTSIPDRIKKVCEEGFYTCREGTFPPDIFAERSLPGSSSRLRGVGGVAAEGGFDGGLLG